MLNMEREKNEKLTARKIEEEKMKRELTDIGIYDPGITYKEMKEILGFINGSQDISNDSNKDIHKGQHTNNQHFLEIASDTNVPQEIALQEYTEISRLSYSYKLNCTSPTAHEHKVVHYINSPKSPIFEVQNPVYRCENSDNDKAFEKQLKSINSIHSTNHFLSLRSTNISQGCQNVASKKTMQDTQSEFVQRLERWRLNPLDVCINKNDVPLQQPNRSLTGKLLLFKCKEMHTSEQREQAIQFVSQHLKEIADLWYSWHHTTNLIFQWGSPIQVDIVNLDKKSLVETKNEQIKTKYICRDNHERASKRKASSLIASLTRESSTEDEEDKYDIVRDKKKKIQFGDKSNNIQYAENQHMHNDNHEKATLSMIAYQKNFINDNNNDMDFDNEHIKFACSKKIDEKNESIPVELNKYLRRIILPTPKAHLGLSRLRRETVTSKLFPKMRCVNENKIMGTKLEKTKKQKTAITDKEINQLIEDRNSDEEEIVKKNVKMRPLPLSKEIQSRLLYEKQLSLHNTEAIKKTMAKEEESDEERKKKKRAKLCKQRKKEKELCKIKNENRSWEHQLSDDENKLSETNQDVSILDVQNGNQSDDVTSLINNVSCPICNKLFPYGEIENHAADCEQFETNNEENENDVIKLECNICNNYETSIKMEYEKHIQQCINRHDKRYSCGSQDIDIVPASSFHI